MSTLTLPDESGCEASLLSIVTTGGLLVVGSLSAFSSQFSRLDD